MLYHTDPNKSRRDFLLHLPTYTLAELLLNGGTGGNNVLLVDSDAPAPDDAFQEMAAWLHGIHSHADENLTIISRKRPPEEIPHTLLLASSSGAQSIIIHSPHLGFTAGITATGEKIPPHWQRPADFSREQKSHIIAQMADELMRYVAAFQKRQGT